MQLASVDLNLLVVLDAVLEARSVKRAAAKLALSPSATSHALTRARELLGDPILVRAGNEMVLTARAVALKPRVREILEGIERALAGEGELDPSALRRSFTLAATDYVELLLVSELSRQIAREAPGVELYTRRLSDAMTEQLRSGSCDLAFGVFPQIPDDIVQEPLFRDTLVCLLRRGHPVLKKRLTPERYAALDHIVVSVRGGIRSAVDEILAERGLERRVARTVSSFVAAPFLVAGSNYVLTMPSRIAQRLAGRLGLVIRKPPLALPSFAISVAWQARYHGDPGHRWLRQRVIDTAGRMEDRTA